MYWEKEKKTKTQGSERGEHCINIPKIMKTECFYMVSYVFKLTVFNKRSKYIDLTEVSIVADETLIKSLLLYVNHL
jgi:hypothetical protein